MGYAIPNEHDAAPCLGSQRDSWEVIAGPSARAGDASAKTQALIGDLTLALDHLRDTAKTTPRDTAAIDLAIRDLKRLSMQHMSEMVALLPAGRAK
ncbi:hypothetical protein [Polycladidibacter hongkongensis]|uniref:hypothetical protein n=1 Tax=Polycladidibacter hongkongensis TaxID=1647556 RepID=UPI000834E32E|nr:hypothetical protein [Pseudovibrio hongkongensis]